MPVWATWIFNLLLNWAASKIAALVALYRRDKANHAKQVADATLDTEKASKLSESSDGDAVTEANNETLKRF